MDVAFFPTGLCSAPVIWEYLGQKIPLKFQSGFLGASQDPVTNVIAPQVGWFLLFDKNKESS